MERWPRRPSSFAEGISPGKRAGGTPVRNAVVVKAEENGEHTVSVARGRVCAAYAEHQKKQHPGGLTFGPPVGQKGGMEESDPISVWRGLLGHICAAGFLVRMRRWPP